MKEFTLFEKKEATNINEYSELIKLLTAHNFKVSSTLEKNVNEVARKIRNNAELSRKDDYIVAWVSTKDKDDYMCIYSSQYAKKRGYDLPARYTIRIKKTLLDRLVARNNAFLHLFGSTKMSHNDTTEYSTFYFSVADLYRFFETFFYYNDVAKQTKSATKESEIKTA